MREHDAPFGSMKYWLSLAAFVLWVSAAAELRADQTVVVRSGNGAVGTQDSQVRFLPYGVTSDVTPQPVDFVTVQSGQFAYIDAPGQSGPYILQLPADPNAKWIAQNPS